MKVDGISLSMELTVADWISDSPDMCDGLEGLGNAWEGAVAEHHRDLGQGGDFEKRLDLIEGLAMGRIANAEAVVG